MLLFGLESSRSPRQCYNGLDFRCSSAQTLSCHLNPAEREFLLES